MFYKKNFYQLEFDFELVFFILNSSLSVIFFTVDEYESMNIHQQCIMNLI